MRWKNTLMLWISTLALETIYPENTKKEILNILSTKEPLELNQVEHLSEKEDSSQTYKVKISELEGGPLRWSKKIIDPTYGNLIGVSQFSSILKEGFSTDSVQITENTIVKSSDSISIPLIYPELKKYFPEQLDTLLEKAPFSKYKQNKSDHILIVSQCENGRNALAYYENWTLKLATHVSIGTRGNQTPKWRYPLSHDEIFRRSKTYQNAPMPYSLKVFKGIFLHQWRSDGLPRSHGCIRVPWLYQKRIYENLPKGKATIILEGLYKPTLKTREKDAETLLPPKELPRSVLIHQILSNDSAWWIPPSLMDPDFLPWSKAINDPQTGRAINIQAP